MEGYNNPSSSKYPYDPGYGYPPTNQPYQPPPQQQQQQQQTPYPYAPQPYPYPYGQPPYPYPAQAHQPFAYHPYQRPPGPYPYISPPIDSSGQIRVDNQPQVPPDSNSSHPSVEDVDMSSDSVPSSHPVHPLQHSSAAYFGDYEYQGNYYYGYPSPNTGWDGSYSDNRMNPQTAPCLTRSVSLCNYNQNPHQANGHNMQLVPFSSPNSGSLKVMLLHGNLDIWINNAKCLPNMDKFHSTLGDVFGNFPGKGSKKPDGMPRKITSDPYVSISIAGAVIGRTYVLSNDENPVWSQHFYVSVAHYAAEIYFLVKDSDIVGSQLIGIVTIPIEKIISGSLVKDTYPILNSNGKPCKPGAMLSLSIQYMPMEKLSIYHHGVGAGPDYQGVPDTYFPLRKGGLVTLYQDAHVPDGHLPNILLDSGLPYVHGKCWHDICDAISHARRLIYITGWSVWHKVQLVRDGPPADYSLGELLRSKSQEGVRILLLVWDDPTSRSILGYKTDGLMQTHDEETRRFFKHSSVQVLLCPRIAGKRHSWVKQREVETIYTHHQKTVIVDADAGNNARKIIAFVGGLDLCDGRYDTPTHPLFRTLETVHQDDYHNPSFTGKTHGCPREPWHDLHSRIDGPAAYDVLTNFEERWIKAAKPQGMKKLKKSYDDALLRIDRVKDIIKVSDAPYVSDDGPESWHVQIFRSIDSNSVKRFPKDPKQACTKNLVCGKNVLIDMSIHSAYVKAIRSAQHFIYIENQYFIGSSYNWHQHKDIGANNLIPMEIALKIASKIKAHERFATYVVIPMWPEGVPTGAATQRILYWQHKTMQMMYETIYKALVEVGLEEYQSPQDYLNFFCLGNREDFDPNPDHSSMGSPHAPNTPQALCQKTRRFMIYVHSKGMIVDDEYLILGSANINQRSLEGTRDTEIAMGAYQPNYTWERKLAHPHGQIYGYRMSLWAEHLGGIEEIYNEPNSLECVRRVRHHADTNWKQFASERVTEMNAHLLKYPVEVDPRGKVKPLHGCEQFPDINGNICGSFLAIQENLTI